MTTEIEAAEAVRLIEAIGTAEALGLECREVGYVGRIEQERDLLREALIVATTTVEDWQEAHECLHPDPAGFRRAALEHGREVLAVTSSRTHGDAS